MALEEEVVVVGVADGSRMVGMAWKEELKLAAAKKVEAMMPVVVARRRGFERRIDDDGIALVIV